MSSSEFPEREQRRNPFQIERDEYRKKSEKAIAYIHEQLKSRLKGSEVLDVRGRADYLTIQVSMYDPETKATRDLGIYGASGNPEDIVRDVLAQEEKFQVKRRAQGY